MSRSLARTAALAAVLSAALLGVLAAPALAVTTAPAPGTPACTAAVNNDATVQAAVAAVNTARTTLLTDQTNGAPAATITADQAAVDNAVNHVTVVRQAASDALCTGTATGTGIPRTVTATTTPPVVPTVKTIAALDAAIDAITCVNTNHDVQAIAYEIRVRAQAGKDVSEPVARLQAKTDALRCAGATFTPRVVVPGTVTEVAPSTTVASSRVVVATADDGSVPTVSGRQVIEAPVGSASTGAL